MSLTSFLSGAPMTYSPGFSQSSTSLPSWYTDYTSAILGNAAQFANQGAPAFQGPQVAALSPLSTSAANTVQGQTGVGSGIAQQGVGQVNSALAGPNAYSAGNPYLSSAASGVNSALRGPNALSAAQPYLNNAASPLAGNIGQFLNPYTQDVINTTDALSARNFNQNVMPSLQNAFTAAGQVYGGSGQGYDAAILGSQEQQNEAAINAGLESQGFNTALSGATNQANINAGLAGTAASAANAAQGTGLSGANIMGGLGSTAGSLANATQGTKIAGGQALGSLGTTAQNNALNQALVQNQFGQQQQQQQQQNYNTALNNYYQQYYSPLIASQAMQGALSGIQIPQGQTNYTYQPYGLGQSPLQGAVGTGNTIGNLLSPLFDNQTMNNFPAARGGHIRYARGGLARRPTLTLPNRQSAYRPLALPSYKAA